MLKGPYPMKVFSFKESQCPVAQDLNIVSQLILEGGVGVLPTDTLYGLSGLADEMDVLERVLQIKRRESPCSIIPPSLSWVLSFAEPRVGKTLLKDALEKYAGPWTMLWPVQDFTVLPAPLTSSGLVGIRQPAHWCLALAQKLDRPLITTSVNRHGEAPIERLADLSTELESELDFFIDEGKKSGPPSRLVRFDDEYGQPVFLER